MIHRAPSRGSCIDARAAGDCERAAQVQRRLDALPPVSVDRKLELALASDFETNCRLEYAVTVSFLHEERVRLRDSAEAADRPHRCPCARRRGQRPVASRAGTGPGVGVILSTVSKVSDPVAAPVFATPEATWTVAAAASPIRPPRRKENCRCKGERQKEAASPYFFNRRTLGQMVVH